MNAIQATINFALQFIKEFADEMFSISCLIFWFAHHHYLLSAGRLGVHAAEQEKQDVAVAFSDI